MDIKTSKVLLIGATGGIGQKIAEVLQYAGARLFLVGRNTSKLEYLRTRIGQGHDNEPLIITADITTLQGRKNILEFVNRYPGGINMVINCAGINNFDLLEDMDETDIQKIIDTNLTAPLQLIGLLLPHLKGHPRSLIMNVGSTFGSIGFAGFSIYSASKFALRGFTEALRRELSDTGITVSYIAPRTTDTELNSPEIFAMNKELKVSIDQPIIVAKEVLDAITTDAEEIYIGWPEKLFVKLNHLIPRLVDKALKKKLSIIRHYAKQSEYLN